MRELGVALRIKYRLREVPTDAEAAEWARRTEGLIAEGLHPDNAGLQAADQLFEIVQNLVIKAEADTIATLLAQARSK
jgi:hypothetical protein